jgi:DNA anti-recombination protein RmuC
MKQQGNSSPSKVNATTKELNNSKEEEKSNVEFQKIIVRMIDELKEQTHKLVSEIKEEINKQLKELKKNSNKKMNEIKKTMQNIK